MQVAHDEEPSVRAPLVEQGVPSNSSAPKSDTKSQTIIDLNVTAGPAEQVCA